jgi:uncharacterized protein
MPTRDREIKIEVGARRLEGTFVTPATLAPGVLFIHGWGGNQAQYLARARELAGLGCVCLTFNLHANEPAAPEHQSVTREDNLRDAVSAYDWLVQHPDVDKEAIAVIGSSYGGYLGAILTTERPVRWLGLRAPALYKDEDWTVPKKKLDVRELAAYRRTAVAAAHNRALTACAAFTGDVLIVESEHDDIVPHPVIENYQAAFEKARSRTFRAIAGADHALSKLPWQQQYTSILVNWATEMMIGARKGALPAGIQGEARAPGGKG